MFIQTDKAKIKNRLILQNKMIEWNNR